jgi:hypothetical protein
VPPQFSEGTGTLKCYARIASMAFAPAREIEKYVKKRARELATGDNKSLPLALVMTDGEFQRWTFCVEASRRADESADRLLKSLREEMERIQGAGQQDLVGEMARLNQAETVEVEPEPDNS